MKAFGIVRRPGSHISYTIGSEMAVRLSALRAGEPSPPSKIPSTDFGKRLSRPQGDSASGKISETEKSNDLGNRTRDLQACGIVPQPPTLKHVYSLVIDSRSSAVSILTNCGLYDRVVGIRVPVGQRIFFSQYRPALFWRISNILSSDYQG
jgi:hypothetical protein